MSVQIDINNLDRSIKKIMIGGNEISVPDDGIVSGSIEYADSGWTPMYFLGPNKYIWVNFDTNNNGSFISGAMCFNENPKEQDPYPLCPSAFSWDASKMILTIKGSNIGWAPNMACPPCPPPPMTYISTADAIAQTEAWRQYLHTHSDLENICAYFIPIEDIMHVINPPATPANDTIGGIRVYFALKQMQTDRSDTETTKKITPAPQTPHLLVVPVDTNGADIIVDDKKDTSVITNIYDTTMPCPKFCSGDSYLYPTARCNS